MRDDAAADCPRDIMKVLLRSLVAAGGQLPVAGLTLATVVS